MKLKLPEFKDIQISREDKRRYTLEPLKLTDPIDDESAESGFVFVVEFPKNL